MWQEVAKRESHNWHSAGPTRKISQAVKSDDKEHYSLYKENCWCILFTEWEHIHFLHVYWPSAFREQCSQGRTECEALNNLLTYGEINKTAAAYFDHKFIIRLKIMSTWTTIETSQILQAWNPLEGWRNSPENWIWAIPKFHGVLDVAVFLWLRNLPRGLSNKKPRYFR